MTIKLTAVLFVIANAAMAQMSGRSPTDRSDIVQRLAVSDTVLIGTIVKQDMYRGVSMSARYAAINEQTTREELLAIQRQSDLENGILYTIRVDGELCRGNDFQSSAPPRPTAEKEVYIFKPASDMMPALDDRNPVEVFAMQGKYLLILKKDPASVELIKTFGLDPKQTYYRAVDRARGAIQLEINTYKQPPVFEMGLKNAPGMPETLREPGSSASKYQLAASVLEARTREAEVLRSDAAAVCDAVRQTSAIQKADGLERLKSSPDLVVRQNAETALKILRGEPLR